MPWEGCRHARTVSPRDLELQIIPSTSAKAALGRFVLARREALRQCGLTMLAEKSGMNGGMGDNVNVHEAMLRRLLRIW